MAKEGGSLTEIYLARYCQVIKASFLNSSPLVRSIHLSTRSAFHKHDVAARMQKMTCYRKSNSTVISDTSTLDVGCVPITSSELSSPCCPSKQDGVLCLSDYLCWWPEVQNSAGTTHSFPPPKVHIPNISTPPSRIRLYHNLLHRLNLRKQRMQPTLHIISKS